MKGLNIALSEFSVKETIDRLSSVVQSHGLTVFARIDHSANASESGLRLRPTELIIFGNPKAGTILMQDKHISGLDLPLRALAWQESDGRVFLAFNEASWISERYNLTEKSAPVVKAIEEGLEKAVASATSNN